MEGRGPGLRRSCPILTVGGALFGPEGRLRNGWKVLLFLAALGLGRILAQGLLPRDLRVLLHGHGLQLLLCLWVTLLFLRAEGRPLASVGLHFDGRWARQFLGGTLAGIALMGLTALVIMLCGGVRLTRNPGAGAATLLGGAWLYLVVAFSEELGFRGYLFQRLEEGLGSWPTLALLALFFALGHWGNPGMAGATLVWATLNIALAAVLLGLCYLRTRSLALPMGVHLGWNWGQGGMLGFGVSGTQAAGWWTPVFQGRPAWLTGGAFGLEASLPCAVLCLLACLWLARWRANKPLFT